MGISICSRGSKHHFDCGYGGFFNLRKHIG